MTALALALGLVTLPAGAAPAPQAPAAPAARPADPIAHDPTVVKDGRWYYLVITGDAGRANTYLPVKRSRDLVSWTELGPVFDTLPEWILPALGVTAAEAPKDLWAPDLSYAGGEWRLYYAASQFGRNNSVIGLATTKSLDPASPDYGWVDRGLVLQSKPATTPDPQEFNAIDPEVTVDAQGRRWLAFGSFWTGLKMRRLAADGFLSRTDTTLHDLATRPTPPDAIENPSILRQGNYYYLFAAFDFCCRGVDGDYRTVVGRSTSITGPYVDRAGVPLLEGGGTEVLRGYNEFAGTGGADTLRVGRRTYLVNHYYDATDEGAPRVNIRPMRWRGGWPVVGEPLNPSRTIGRGNAYVRIVPRGSSLAVANSGCGFEGAPLTLEVAGSSTCQQWQLDDRGAGSRILNRFSNKVAEVAACNNVDGGRVAQWGWLGFLDSNDCQRWSFVTAPGGYSAITSVLPGARVWQPAGDRGTSGTPIEITTAEPTAAATQFRFLPVGRVLLANTAGTRALGVVGCSDSRPRGRDVALQRRDRAGCQEWQVRAVAGDRARVTVTDVASGRQLAVAGCTRRRPGPAGDDLRVVDPTAANRSCRSWTLAPTNDGTWRLGGPTGRTVRLVQP